MPYWIIHFFSLHFVSYRSVSFRSVSFRFYFVSHFIGTHLRHHLNLILSNSARFSRKNGYYIIRVLWRSWSRKKHRTNSRKNKFISSIFIKHHQLKCNAEHNNNYTFGGFGQSFFINSISILQNACYGSKGY